MAGLQTPPLVAAAADPLVDMADRTEVETDGRGSCSEALNGEKPKAYEEFIEQIINNGRADGIHLPILPYDREYGHDARKQSQVVIEYAAKKKAMNQQTARYGDEF